VLCFLLCWAVADPGGVEWMPDYVPPVVEAPVTPPSSSETVVSTDVGKFVSSSRVAARSYYTKADKGIFMTYTSLSVPVGSPVVYEVHTDKVTGLALGKLIRSLKVAILVESVLPLN